jgi:hypothetical protein
MAGTPDYGYTGGGLLFWDRETRQSTLLGHTELLPEHSTQSLAPLPGGRLMGGSTTSPGTGGEKKASEAELYILDMATKRVQWHAAVFPGAQTYTDLHLGPDGLVFGFVDRALFFVFDPAARAIVHREVTAERRGPTISHQGPRVFVADPDSPDTIYVLFEKGIARLDSRSYAMTLIAQSPVSIQAGGDVLDGRLYFAHGSELWSCAVPAGRGAGRRTG